MPKRKNFTKLDSFVACCCMDNIVSRNVPMPKLTFLNLTSPDIVCGPFWFTFADGVKTRQIAILGLKLITFIPYTFFPNAEIKSSSDFENSRAQYCQQSRKGRTDNLGFCELKQKSNIGIGTLIPLFYISRFSL